MRNFLPWSHPILLLRDHGLGLFKVLLQVLEAGQHLVEVLRFLAVLDGLNIGIDGRIPKQLIKFQLFLAAPEVLSPLLLGGPHYPLLIFLVVREEKGSVDSGGRLLLDLKENTRVNWRKVAGYCNSRSTWISGSESEEESLELSESLRPPKNLDILSLNSSTLI